MAAIAAIGVAHGERWPEITNRGIDRSEAYYGTGVEPVNVMFTWTGLPSCRIGLRVTPDGHLRRVTIDAGDDAELTARTLHDLPLGMLRDAASDYVRRMLAATDPGSGPADRRDANVAMQLAWARGFEEQQRPGRRGRPALFYAQLARSYTVALEADPAKPVPELKRRLESDGIYLSISQIRDLLHQARRKGMLTRAPKGRPGGELTEDARRLLEREGK
jgi:hypothetical protein